jgi:hypothetical protein
LLDRTEPANLSESEPLSEVSSGTEQNQVVSRSSQQTYRGEPPVSQKKTSIAANDAAAPPNQDSIVGQMRTKDDGLSMSIRAMKLGMNFACIQSNPVNSAKTATANANRSVHSVILGIAINIATKITEFKFRPNFLYVVINIL